MVLKIPLKNVKTTPDVALLIWSDIEQQKGSFTQEDIEKLVIEQLSETIFGDGMRRIFLTDRQKTLKRSYEIIASNDEKLNNEIDEEKMEFEFNEGNSPEDNVKWNEFAVKQLVEEQIGYLLDLHEIVRCDEKDEKYESN